jgi:quercetin dioxygenase-like cupin family protein
MAARSRVAPHRLDLVLKRLPPLRPSSRTRAPAGDPAFASTPFTKLAPFNHGGVFVGRFTGRTPWERHRGGDELVHVLAGEVDLTVLKPSGPVHVTLTAGSVFVVPRGRWHRQRTRGDVALLTATPTPTDISFDVEPRSRSRTRPRRS